MRVNKAKIRSDIQALMDTLKPYGITKPIQIVRLQTEYAHGEDGWTPSDAYIRLMLSQRDEPLPGERFCNWFYALADYIYEGMSRDTDTIAMLAKSVGVGVTTEYVRRLRFVTMPDNVKIEDFDLIMANSDDALNLALIPDKLRRVCQWEECGRVFPGGVQDGYCCKRHKQLAKNKRRRDQRRARRAQGVIQLAEAA